MVTNSRGGGCAGTTSSLGTVSMLRAIQNLKTNEMLTYSNDVLFRAFVCAGLKYVPRSLLRVMGSPCLTTDPLCSQCKLHEWFQLLCTANETLLNKFYLTQSIVRSPPLVQSVAQLLQPLSLYTFKLDVELEAQAKPQRGVAALASISKSIAGVLR